MSLLTVNFLKKKLFGQNLLIQSFFVMTDKK